MTWRTRLVGRWRKWMVRRQTLRAATQMWRHETVQRCAGRKATGQAALQAE
jgi:hypothetical protein